MRLDVVNSSDLREAPLVSLSFVGKQLFFGVTVVR
jgi:hypothetical protein